MDMALPNPIRAAFDASDCDEGAVVVNIGPSHPATHGTIQVIAALDGEKVSNNDDLYKILDKHQVGETVNVEVMRNGRSMTVSVKLMEAPQRRQGIRE